MENESVVHLKTLHPDSAMSHILLASHALAVSPHTHNPWLYIIIGFLLVTGILLYIDPRIF
jgi:hypothetical protein